MEEAESEQEFVEGCLIIRLPRHARDVSFLGDQVRVRALQVSFDASWGLGRHF
jgi:hypothetical protein